MDDIEDLVRESSEVADVKERQELNDELVLPKRSRSKKPKQKAIGYDIPGTQTVFVKTFGCSHNVSDSEYMVGQLVNYGYGVTENFENADCYLINSCTVKNPSEDSFVNLVEKARSSGKPVVVAGCVPQGQPKNSKWKGLSVIGVQQINRVVEVVEESLRGNQVKFLSRGKRNMPTLDLPKIRRNPFIEIIPINVGCLNQCTYCKTKHARGELISWPIEDIVERVKQAQEEGVTEIRITSEDTGAYGIDLGTTIVQLLTAICDVLEENVMLRVGMTNPPYILDHLDAIAKILNHPNVYSFLHIPVQAASNGVLDQMKRLYTIEDFERVVDTLLSKVPGLTIATDIICGFPTETDEDFEKTLALIQKYKFPAVNISQFYPRPGTPAARMKRVPTKEVKARSRKLTTLFESYQPYDNLIDTEQKVWITEKAHDGKNLVGHTKAYVQVIVDPAEAELGTNVVCKITETGKHFIRGAVVSKSSCTSIPPVIRSNFKDPLSLKPQPKLKNKKRAFMTKSTGGSENVENVEQQHTLSFEVAVFSVVVAFVLYVVYHHYLLSAV